MIKASRLACAGKTIKHSVAHKASPRCLKENLRVDFMAFIILPPGTGNGHIGGGPDCQDLSAGIRGQNANVAVGLSASLFGAD
jgi:hypothetical protein